MPLSDYKSCERYVPERCVPTVMILSYMFSTKNIILRDGRKGTQWGHGVGSQQGQGSIVHRNGDGTRGRDTAFKDVLSKGRTAHVQGTHCPRDALSMGRIVR